MTRPSLNDVPEQAIRAFEKHSGLQVCVHDLDSTFGTFLHPERFKHRGPACLAVKTRHEWACVDFEVTRLRGEAKHHLDGRYHRCHAGFVEWMVPSFVDERLAWILFAGQARTAGEFQHLVRDVRTTHPASPNAASLARVDEAQAELILESLRQLRARLQEWRRTLLAATRNAPRSPGAPPSATADRRWFIQNFLNDYHTDEATLGDLAKALRLSESRTTHLVKELFGCGYPHLLNEIRLRTAANLLRATALSVAEVGLHSGFRDVSHFHRVFQKRFATTPRRYRLASRT